MQTVIVDTDVVSFIFKRDTRATLYEPYLNGVLASVSFVLFHATRLLSVPTSLMAM